MKTNSVPLTEAAVAATEGAEEKVRKQRATYYSRHKEQEKANMRAYYQKHKARLDAKSLAQYYKNKPARLDQRMKRTYGVDKAGVAAILESQQGRCAICQTTVPGKPGWCLDHHHESGANRGVLCPRCNTGLGFLRDDPEVLRRAATYLETHSNLRSTTNANNI
jgi:hypothetical protein